MREQQAWAAMMLATSGSSRETPSVGRCRSNMWPLKARPRVVRQARNLSVEDHSPSQLLLDRVKLGQGRMRKVQWRLRRNESTLQCSRLHLGRVETKAGWSHLIKTADMLHLRPTRSHDPIQAGHWAVRLDYHHVATLTVSLLLLSQRTLPPLGRSRSPSPAQATS